MSGGALGGAGLQQQFLQRKPATPVEPVEGEPVKKKRKKSRLESFPRFSLLGALGRSL